MSLQKFGPVRTIGFSYVGANDAGQIPKFWETVVPRLGEIPAIDNSPSFGICRCKEGAQPGEFEYIAALQAQEGAEVPPGQVEIVLPELEYLVIPVPSLAEIMKAFGTINDEISKLGEYEGYCNQGGCDCSTAPTFEYYPPAFPHEPELFIYVPVRKKS